MEERLFPSKEKETGLLGDKIEKDWGTE